MSLKVNKLALYSICYYHLDGMWKIEMIHHESQRRGIIIQI